MLATLRRLFFRDTSDEDKSRIKYFYLGDDNFVRLQINKYTTEKNGKVSHEYMPRVISGCSQTSPGPYTPEMTTEEQATKWLAEEIKKLRELFPDETIHYKVEPTKEIVEKIETSESTIQESARLKSAIEDLLR